MSMQPDPPPGTFAPLPRRPLIALVLMALVVAGSILLWLYIVYFRQKQPTPVYAKIGKPIPLSVYRKGHNAYLTLQTVGSTGTPPHPDWVSYYAQTPQGKWVHSTVLRVPSYSLVHVTLYEYDSQTGLRNPFLAQARGLVGPMLVNGKKRIGISSATPAHTFTVPELGISVPLYGVTEAEGKERHECSVAPCNTSQAHNTIKFTFRVAGPGTYRWQCFVPCAAGFIYGNGGPMQTLGYMDGYLVVL